MDDNAAASYPNKDKVVFNKTMLFFSVVARGAVLGAGPALFCDATPGVYK